MYNPAFKGKMQGWQDLPPSPREAHRPSSKDECKNWAKKGVCGYGAAHCRFMHPGYTFP